MSIVMFCFVTCIITENKTIYIYKEIKCWQHTHKNTHTYMFVFCIYKKKMQLISVD